MQNKIIFFAVIIILILWIANTLLNVKKPFLRAISSGLTGPLCFTVLSCFPSITGGCFFMNFASLGFCAITGIPGVILLGILNFIL